eukprot:6491023-Amphidinium_carterae.2
MPDLPAPGTSYETSPDLGKQKRPLKPSAEHFGPSNPPHPQCRQLCLSSVALLPGPALGISFAPSSGTSAAPRPDLFASTRHAATAAGAASDQRFP